MTCKIQSKLFLYCSFKDAQLAFLIFISISLHRLPLLYNIVPLPMFILTEGLNKHFLVIVWCYGRVPTLSLLSKS